jgi:hypothetical protein
MNRITRVLQMVCNEFEWNSFWTPFIAPFIRKGENIQKMCNLYDEIEKIVEEK